MFDLFTARNSRKGADRNFLSLLENHRDFWWDLSVIHLDHLMVMDAFYSSEQSFVIVEILASNDLRFDFQLK